MVTRRTIQNDPLRAVEEPDADAAASPTAAAPPQGEPEKKRTAAVAKLKDAARRVLGSNAEAPEARARLANGGRLELLGGDFGVGLVSIRRLDPDDRLGFLSLDGARPIVLDQQVEAVSQWPDRHENRLLSAAGWAWTLGAVAGLPGAAVGAGVRLLHPPRRMVDVELRDGRRFVARTDGVTAAGLVALALWSAKTTSASGRGKTDMSRGS